MNWQTQRNRIRRYLRDPDGNIWADGEILRAYNVAQQELVDLIGPIEDVQAVRLPPQYRMSYTFDWEWQYAGGGADSYQWAKIHEQSGFAFCFEFEAEVIANAGETTSDAGSAYTHPWEAWMGITPNRVPPCWVPERFHEIVGLYHDKDPLEPTTKKEVMRDDTTWQSRTGEPQAYYRDESLENHIYPYPIPSSVTWDDDSGAGTVLFRNDGTDNDTVSGTDAGAIVDYTDSVFSQDGGAVFDITDFDNNLLMIFRKLPRDLTGDGGDSSDYPAFLRKYIEYGTLERCYRMDNDGKIGSLADYWEYRKRIAIEAVKRYKIKKAADRDYRFTAKGSPAMRNRRHPRLPDAYPAVRP